MKRWSGQRHKESQVDVRSVGTGDSRLVTVIDFLSKLVQWCGPVTACVSREHDVVMT